MWNFFLNVSKITSSVQSVDVIEGVNQGRPRLWGRTADVLQSWPSPMCSCITVTELADFFSFSFSFLSFSCAQFLFNLHIYALYVKAID